QPGPIWAGQTPASIQAGTQPLLLNAYLAGYAEKLHQSAAKFNFPSRPAVIDLSGRFPGSVYALGGLTPGTPWIVAGYPGSQDFFSVALAKISCEQLAQTLLLWEADPVVPPLDPSVLRLAGLDAEQDFEAVSTLPFPYYQEDQFLFFRIHILLKPRQPPFEMYRSCLAARGQPAPET
ncbi:MAG: hypothetical protein LBK52_07410, partial [Deltaproteobacteria bacterium]|nr:hypothetical protein [Deltaproteobacteria bacterium]